MENRDRLLSEAERYDETYAISLRMADYDEAIRCALKALEIRNKTLDKYHPALAGSYRNLAHTYQEMGRPVEAMANIIKAMKIFTSLSEDEREKLKDIPMLNVTVSTQLKERPFSILSFKIKDFFDIRHIEIHGIPYNAGWIFLTGENGFGKTLILQALVIGLSGNTDGRRSLTEENLTVEMDVIANGAPRRIALSEGNDSLLKNLIAYGPVRLNLASKNEEAEKSTSTYNLFHPDGLLLDIEKEMVNWQSRKDPRYDAVKGIFLRLLRPYISNIRVEKIGIAREYRVVYSEREPWEDGKEISERTWEQLASGLKSIVDMFGDMLIRFNKRGVDISKPEEIAGIVFIDEFDIHWHPKWQRDLPARLSDVFPRIQFVVSTHSPIPLLGAPEKTVILNVPRTSEKGIGIKRLDTEIEFRNLTPNTILSSPIFGFNEIFSDAHDAEKRIRTEDLYDEARFNDKVKERLRTYIGSEKEEELNEIFSGEE